MFIEISEATTTGPPTTDPIHLVTQFYVPDDPVRHEEIKEALRRNVDNPYISSITLMNERVYNLAELGTSHPKIQQHVIGHRAQFRELLAVQKFGYTVVANADIYTDDSLAKLRSSDLHTRRKMYALLRYELNGALFGPRADSNDTWILHSNNALALHELALFRFPMGRPGCDNKLCYLFKLLGFGIYNDPRFIKTHHSHRSVVRAYGSVKVGPPYTLVVPAGEDCVLFGQPVEVIKEALKEYGWDGNQRLAAYIKSKKGPFVIPRVAGIENHAAMLGHTHGVIRDSARRVLKNNTGLLFDGPKSVQAFSKKYLEAFEHCDLYASWEPWSQYVKHIQESQTFVQQLFPKPQFGAFVLDIYNFVSGEPWTRALAGKRILIVSPCVNEAPQAYPVDLFPGCTFVFVKPPMTQGEEENRGWETEFADLCSRVALVEFDVALCSCGGYGNPLCAFIYSLGRSAIYVGGVLQMYFGIYGERWLREQKDACNLYMTASWKRRSSPPKGFEAIENGCYW